MRALPLTMRAVVIRDYAPGLEYVEVAELPVPAPGNGEVLVHIAAAPVHPADLMFMQGRYGVRKPLPAVPGVEASGQIVAVGEGVPQTWLNRRVACFAAGNGTWAEYMATPVSSCFALADSVSDVQGAMMLVNPFSAYALMEQARTMGCRAIVQTAAASTLGRMIVRLGRRLGIEVICVVRRDAQIAPLQAVGARYILNHNEPTFEKHLREACRQLDARLALDAVGGALTGQVLRALPGGGKVIVYGGLAGEPCQIDVDQLIFKAKSVEGFWLPLWMQTQTTEQMAQAWASVQAWIDADLQSDVRICYALDDALAAIVDYAGQMTGGKVLLVNGTPPGSRPQ